MDIYLQYLGMTNNLFLAGIAVVFGLVLIGIPIVFVFNINPKVRGYVEKFIGIALLILAVPVMVTASNEPSLIDTAVRVIMNGFQLLGTIAILLMKDSRIAELEAETEKHNG